MGDKKTSFFKHFAVIFSGTFINILVGVLTTPIITRLVDPVEYGKLSIFNLYVSLAVIVLCLGLDQALIRFYYKQEDLSYRSSLLKKCVILPLLVTLSISFLFIVLCSTNIIIFEFDTTICIVLCICVIFQLLNRFSFLVVRLDYSSKTYSVLHILHKVSYVVFAILLLYLIDGNDLFLLAFSTTASVAVVTIAGIVIKRSIWFGRIDNKYSISTKDLICFGAPFILSMGIAVLFQGIDKIAINYFCDYSEVGIYASAMSLVHIFSILQSTFNSLWTPMATENYEKNPEDRTFYQKGNAYITILMFAFGLCLILCKDVFAILLGEKYREAAYILPCLAFNPIMYTISESTVNGINFAKKSHLHIWTSVIACVVNIVGNIILVPDFGGRGAAISTGLAYIVFYTMRTMLSKKYFPVNYKLCRFYIITVVTFLYALYNTFFAFDIISILGFLICFAILLLLYRKEFLECIKIAKMFIKKKNKNESEINDEENQI